MSIACHPEEEFEAYAYLYLLQPVGAVVIAGADVPLNNAGVLHNIGFSAPGAIIEKSGDYEINYGVNAISSAGTAALAVAVNGVAQLSTIIAVSNTVSDYSGRVILSLNRNDVVTLRNALAGGTNSFTTTASPFVGAQLTLELLG